jgi:fibronectin-binding autotransporter adhesin
MSRSTGSIIVSTLAFTALFCGVGRAQDVFKAAGGTDLADGASWGGSAPGAGNTAVWDASSLGPGLSLGSNASWGGIRVVNATGAIGMTGAGALTLGAGGVNLGSSAVDMSIANAIVLGASQTWQAGTGRSLSVSGGIGGAGDLTFGFVPASQTSTTFLTTVNQTLFANTSLASVTSTAGLMGGAFVNNGTPLPGNGYQLSNNGATATYWLKIIDGTFTKAVKIEFTQSGADVLARALQAKYTTAQNLAFDFETGGITQTVATSNAAAGYGGHTTTIYQGAFGNGTVLLSGNNTYAGATTVALGTLAVAGGAAIPDASAVTVNTSSTLRLDASETIGSLAGAGAVNLQGNTLTTGANGQNAAHGGVISGAGTLLKTGAGVQTLSGANTFGGGITVSAGTLRATTGGALPSAITLNDGSTGSGNTALLLAGSGVGTARNITVTGNGSGVTTIGSDTGSANNVVFIGTLTVQRPTTLISGTPDRTTYTGRITGNAGTLTVTGGLRTVFESSPGVNDFTGNIVVTGSGTTFQVGAGTMTGENIPDTASVEVGAGTIFKLAYVAGSTETINGLNGSGIVRRHEGVAGAASLVLGAAGGNGNFSGTLENGGGTLSLTKTGAGTQVLSGINTYTGTTTVSGGTLIINGTHAAAGLVNVSSAATLGGNGTVGNVVVADGGILSPGASAGHLTVNNLTLNPSSVMTFELGAPTPAQDAGSDFVTVGDVLTLDGVINITALPGFGAPVAGDSWLIMSAAGGIANNVATIGSAPALSGGLTFAIDASDSANVFLTVVPEAGTSALVLLGALLLRRRRG